MSAAMRAPRGDIARSACIGLNLRLALLAVTRATLHLRQTLYSRLTDDGDQFSLAISSTLQSVHLILHKYHRCRA